MPEVVQVEEVADVVFPLGMVAVVLATGNHYVLDIAGSIVLLIVSIAVVSAWGHLAERLRTAATDATHPCERVPPS
ncbi:phosphatase PAP2 family protein [Nonomuraea angiospora]|uniref:phosphatase PAP2 family protein n=1 Tax=Nonomuraea angiospora TaxID=46172 RepID=UPI003413F9F1